MLAWAEAEGALFTPGQVAWRARASYFVTTSATAQGMACNNSAGASLNRQVAQPKEWVGGNGGARRASWVAGWVDPPFGPEFRACD